MTLRVKSIRSTADEARRRCWLRLGGLGLALVLGGALLPGTGVEAEVGLVGLHPAGRLPAAQRVPAARVLQLDPAGWLTFTRADGDRLSPVAVLTGLDCRAHAAACERLRGGDFAAAAERYRAWLEAGRDGIALRRGLAHSLVLQGDLLGAVRTYSWAWADQPGDVHVSIGLGSVLVELELSAQARDELAGLERGRADSPPTAQRRAAAANNLGIALRSNGQPDEALAVYSEAIAQRPGLAALHHNSGLALLDLERFAEAAAAFRRFARLMPAVVDGYLNQGLALLRAGRPVGAAVALHRALDLAPEHPAALLGLGLASQQLGLDETAVGLLERARAAHPDRVEVLQLLATSLVRSGRLERAADVLEAAFALGPATAETHFKLGLQLLLCEQPERAAGHLMRAMALGRDDADVQFAVGQAWLRAGELEPARRALSAASRLRPESAAVHHALGIALLRADMLDAAVRELELAVALAPEDGDHAAALMRAQRYSGDFAGCARVGRDLARIEPERVGVDYEVALCAALAGELADAAGWLRSGMERDRDGTAIHALWRRVDRLVADGSRLPGPYLLQALIHERRGNPQRALRAWQSFISTRPDADWNVRARRRIQSLRSVRVGSAAAR
jgi:tetratricopeptide (TPR) repeat protein